ncbi:hypothetical protein [Poseidonocella sp. HB161398]|uniref:hypothetical protein n=1 Tax=Poseidonocella sp. HB161398 TaxID=2320855 RepID=UPI001107FB5E|nr:hypothetical protein [Poseidonocella sp. HB161398]
MTGLPRWCLGAPLTVTLDSLVGGAGSPHWSSTASPGRAAAPPSSRPPGPRAVGLTPFAIDMGGGLKLREPSAFDGLHGVSADGLPAGCGSLLDDREADARGLRRSGRTPVDWRAAWARSISAPRRSPAATGPATLADAAERAIGRARAPRLADAPELRAALGIAGARSRRAPTTPGSCGWHALLPLDGKIRRASTGLGGRGRVRLCRDVRRRRIDMPGRRLVATADGRRVCAIRCFDCELREVGGPPRRRRGHMLPASGGLEGERHYFTVVDRTLLASIWQLTRDGRAVEDGVRRAACNAMAHRRDDHGGQHSASRSRRRGRSA